MAIPRGSTEVVAVDSGVVVDGRAVDGKTVDADVAVQT